MVKILKFVIKEFIKGKLFNLPYAYRHIRTDKNEPFYIGIGKIDTDRYKRAFSKRGRNKIWKRIVEKTTYEVEILMWDITLQDALDKEGEFIELYGRINNGTGILANLSGYGGGYFDPSKEVREKQSKRMTGSGNHFYGKKHTEETLVFLREHSRTMERKPLSQETKNKIGLANKGNIPALKGKKDIKGALSRTGVKHHSYSGIIHAYDVNMNLLHSFECPKDAAIFYGIKSTNTIRRVTTKERVHHKGIVFRLNDDKEPIDASKVFIVPEEGKIILDLETGIYYNSIKEAAYSKNITYRNLGRYLNGTRKNITSFISL